MKAPGGLVPAGAVFGALYFAARAAGVASWLCEAALTVPAATAALLLWRRGRRERGRDPLFWRLLALGAATWVLGQALWAVAVGLGQQPGATAGPLTIVLDGCFIGFLAPLVAAVALGPLPPAKQGPVAWADVVLLLVTLAFTFLQLVFLPLLAPGGPGEIRGMLLGGLALVLAGWSASRWRRSRDGVAARTHGLLALFAVAYGLLSAGANGAGGPMPEPGGPWDLAWIVPFVFLAAAAVPAPGDRWISNGSQLILIVGLSPLVLDRVAHLATKTHASPTIGFVGLAALLALGCALRLHLQQGMETRAREDERLHGEEEQRSGRLATLASMSASLVEDLDRAMEVTVERAAAAAANLGPQASRVLGQAERARAIVKEVQQSLRLVRPAVRGAVNVGSLVEETVQAALDEGLPLHVSLSGLSGLPPVWGDAGGLSAAFFHLLRNAAQAAPDVTLRVSAEQQARDVVLRFADEGPGVPPEIRPRIFDPFFTTRPPGKAVGLGLTLVHFVARDHGGSVVLEASEKGACFTVRLPALARRASASVHPRASLAAAVLSAAAAATTLTLVPAAEMPRWSAVFQVAAALAGAAGLGFAGLRRRGRDRVIWLLLAAGPLAWASAEVLRGWGGAGPSPSALQALVELPWAVALLLCLGPRASLPSVLSDAAGLALFVGLALELVVLPAPFTAADRGLALQVAAGGFLLRLGLAGGAAALWLRDKAGEAGRLGRPLAIGLGLWALGATLGGYLRDEGAPAVAGLGGLGFVLPFLLAAAAGLEEARRRQHHPDTAREPGPASPAWPLAALALIAALPLLELLLGAASAHPALDATRAVATRWTIVLVAAVLAARELAVRLLGTQPLAGEEDPPVARAESPLRHAMVGLLHDLESQLSGIRVLGRLLLLEPSESSPRVREAAARIQVRVELASQLVGSLLPAVRSVATLAPLGEVVDEVVELRQADLAHEGILLKADVASDVPLLRLDVPAIRQVVLALVDGACLAMCQARRTGAIAVQATRERDRVVLRVVDEGPGLPGLGQRRLRGARGLGADLRLARQILSLHGGTIEGRNRIPEGVEFVIRLPIPDADGPSEPCPRTSRGDVVLGPGEAQSAERTT